MLSAVWCLLAPIAGPSAPIGVWGILLAAVLAGVIGFSCITTWGRPTTSRIAAGGLSIAMIVAVAGILLAGKQEVKPAAFAGVIALMSGAYALSGAYPDWLPLSKVFGNQRSGTSHESPGHQTENHEVDT
jgi:hypothetical protein